MKNAEEIKKILDNIELQIQKCRLLLDGGVKSSDETIERLGEFAQSSGSEFDSPEGRVIEGVFDGEQMIGPDGKRYSIPANYTSKSKLVEGDMLKLTIDDRGNFLYKQIGPVERERKVGTLVKDEVSGDFVVACGDRMHKVILAAVTYFKGQEGDQAVVLTPKNTDSAWAAIENIIRQT